MKKTCPRCGSEHIEIEQDHGLSFICCLDCGFDEGDEYETPSDRKNNGGKSSPYKRGGAVRTQKR